MTKYHTDIVLNFSIDQSSLYQKFGKIVFDTIIISCFRYTVPYFGIPYFCSIPKCDTTYRYNEIKPIRPSSTILQK